MFIELTIDGDNQKTVVNTDAIISMRAASSRDATLIYTADGQKYFFTETYEQIREMLIPKPNPVRRIR